MKNLYTKITFIVLGILCWGCSDDNGPADPGEPGYAVFLLETLNVPSKAGEVVAQVEWSATTWEIVMDKDIGMITNISQTEGGSAEGQKKYSPIRFSYSENPEQEPRKQEIFLVNRATGERSKLTIEQQTKYTVVPVIFNASVKYQYVAGFGGMYNPKIWLSGNNLITNAEVTKMFAPDQLGYNILRLMVYPNENDWAADVEGAKQAQQHGAIIFACPWDCTDAFAEKITVNGKEYKHLKPEKYQDYANHLVKYINYMKTNGVNLYAISVQNEPDMEFTYWRPAEVVNFVKTYADQIKATGVKLMAPEGCGMQPEYTDPILNDATAFSKTDILAGHLYQGFVKTGESSYVKNRHDYICGLYNSKLASAGKTWWMTEHLFNDGQEHTSPSLWEFRKWSYNMETLAKEIHMCMEGYCSAYIYWYLKRFYGMIADSDERSQAQVGTILKNGYILSHYAKYASGTTRIKVETGDKNVEATAYVNDSGTEVTLVLLNMKTVEYNARIASTVALSSVSGVETTADKDMATVAASISTDGQSASVLLSANSITSVRLKLK